jgi:hypothetical protein
MMINNKRVLIKFGSCPNDNRYYNQSRLCNIRHRIRQQTKRQLKDIADNYSINRSWDNFIQPIC